MQGRKEGRKKRNKGKGRKKGIDYEERMEGKIKTSRMGEKRGREGKKKGRKRKRRARKTGRIYIKNDKPWRRGKKGGMCNYK